MERYRFHPDAPLYFITFAVVDWLPVFVSEEAFKILTDSLNYCHEHKGLRTNAYVIMPTHFHAILFHFSFNAGALQAARNDFRKFTGRQLSDFCARRMPGCFTSTLRDNSASDRERRFWQPSRHPEALLSERFWTQKFDYLHDNPCRKGLVSRADHWRFSSASFWLCEPRPKNDAILTAIEW